MSMGPTDENWESYRRQVMAELGSLRSDIRDLAKEGRDNHADVTREIGDLRNDVGMLKVKASVFGAMSGFGAGIVVYIKSYFGGH